MEGLERKGGGSCLLWNFHIEIKTKFQTSRFKAFFIIYNNLSALWLNGKHFKAEYSVISAKDALYWVFHLQDPLWASSDILLCKYGAARESSTMEIQFTLKVVHYGRDECYLFDVNQRLEMTFSLWSLLWWVQRDLIFLILAFTPVEMKRDLSSFIGC